MLMDIVVIDVPDVPDVPDAWGMLLSRKWSTYIGEHL